MKRAAAVSSAAFALRRRSWACGRGPSADASIGRYVDGVDAGRDRRGAVVTSPRARENARGARVPHGQGGAGRQPRRATATDVWAGEGARPTGFLMRGATGRRAVVVLLKFIARPAGGR